MSALHIDSSSTDICTCGLSPHGLIQAMGAFRVLPLADKSYHWQFFLPLVYQRYQCLPIKFTIGRHFCRRSRALLAMVTFFMTSPKMAGTEYVMKATDFFSQLFPLNLVVAEKTYRILTKATNIQFISDSKYACFLLCSPYITNEYHVYRGHSICIVEHLG